MSAHNTPDLRPSAVGLTPLSSGQAFNQLKRTLSQGTEITEEADVANGRRSKRIKKGKPNQYLQQFLACGPNRVRMLGWMQAQLFRRRCSHWSFGIG